MCVLIDNGCKLFDCVQSFVYDGVVDILLTLNREEGILFHTLKTS